MPQEKPYQDFDGNVVPIKGLTDNWSNVENNPTVAMGDGGGNNGGGDNMDRGYIDSRIEATEARTNEKIGELRADISKLDTDLNHLEMTINEKPGKIWTLSLALGIVVTVLGGIAAIFTFSTDGFVAGYSVAPAISETLKRNSEETDKKLEALKANTEQQIDRLEKVIIKAIAEKKEK